MFKWMTRALVLSLALATMAACTSAPLKPAAPIAVPPHVTRTQVRQSIVSALEGRGWTLDKVGDKAVLTTLHLRGHTATVRVAYDRQDVRIAYVSSSKLEFRESHGKRYIHRNYNGWIKFLEQDIRRNLQNASATAGS